MESETLGWAQGRRIGLHLLDGEKLLDKALASRVSVLPFCGILSVNLGKLRQLYNFLLDRLFQKSIL